MKIRVGIIEMEQSIPVEIRKLSNIEADANFTITIDEKEKRVCLIPDVTD